MEDLEGTYTADSITDSRFKVAAINPKGIAFILPLNSHKTSKGEVITLDIKIPEEGAKIALNGGCGVGLNNKKTQITLK